MLLVMLQMMMVGVAVDLTRSSEPARAVLSHRADIDIVLFWVDGHDPSWQERFRARAVLEGLHFRRGFVRDRYFDGGELVYCLRAIEKYMPWYRMVHVITDGQWPGWMRLDHPRMMWHNHSELLGAGSYSFSSGALQLNLLNLSHLAERFILFDDDQFVLGPLLADDWFTAAGLPRVRAANQSCVGSTNRTLFLRGKCNPASAFQVYMSGVFRSWELVWERFGQAGVVGNAHVPIPLTRTLLSDMNATYDLMDAAGLSFRSCHAPQFQSLVIFHGLARGMIETVLGGYERLWDKGSCRRFAASGRRGGIELLCANACDAEWVSKVMPTLFGKSSTFEKPGFVRPPSPTPMDQLPRWFC